VKPRWNLLRAALYGFIVGAVFGLFGAGGANSLVRGAGFVVGSGIGVAVLFGLVAGMRNLIVRAS